MALAIVLGIVFYPLYKKVEKQQKYWYTNSRKPSSKFPYEVIK